MLEKFASLSLFDYFYAALLALLITYMIRRVGKLKTEIKKDELQMNVANIDKRSVIEKCIKMFPIDTVNFNGKVFTKGMTIKITTMQKKVFQGELVGKNEADIICILTREHIIAHEIRKITEMVSVDDIK